MIYVLQAYAVTKDANETHHMVNDMESYVAMPLLIDAQSTRDAMEFAKEMIADIYDGDVAVEVATNDKFELPFPDEDDCQIVLQCWRVDGKWRYVI